MEPQSIGAVAEWRECLECDTSKALTVSDEKTKSCFCLTQSKTWMTLKINGFAKTEQCTKVLKKKNTNMQYTSLIEMAHEHELNYYHSPYCSVS